MSSDFRDVPSLGIIVWAFEVNVPGWRIVLENIKAQVSYKHLTQVEQQSWFTPCFHLIQTPPTPPIPISLPLPSVSYFHLSLSLWLCNTAVLQSCWCDRSKHLQTIHTHTPPDQAHQAVLSVIAVHASVIIIDPNTWLLSSNVNWILM